MIRNANQTVHINFRATLGEKKAVIIMAKREGINKTEMLRKLIQEGARIRGLNPLGMIDLPELKKVVQNE